MAEAAGMHLIEHLFPGMSKRRVAQIMPQGNSLYQIFIQTQRLCNRSGILGDLQRMRKPCPVVISPRRQKHLGFML